MRKKLIFICAIWAIFLSCNLNNWEDTVITNNSDFKVSFKFSNNSERHLEAGESATFETKAHQHLESYSPDKRVYFTYQSTNDGYTGQFNTRQSWLVKVNNTIGEQAALSAGGWMDTMADIKPGKDDDINHNGIIYSDMPIFTVITESGFPAVAVYNKTESVVFVTIQWSP